MENDKPATKFSEFYQVSSMEIMKIVQTIVIQGLIFGFCKYIYNYISDEYYLLSDNNYFRLISSN